MKKVCLIPFLIILPITIISSLLYFYQAEPIYRSTSEILINRDRIDGYNQNYPEIRNRWVWLRDGLAVKNKLLSIDKSDLFLHKKIDISFTGADDYRYIISVQDSTISKAEATNKLLIKKLHHLINVEPIQNLDRLIHSLSNKIETLRKKDKLDEDFSNGIKKSIQNMAIKKIILNSNKKDRIKILQNPESETLKIWPKLSHLLALAILISILLSFSYGSFRLLKRKNSNASV